MDPDTGALTIAAEDSDPGRAEAVAKAYTKSFVNQMQAIATDEVNKINLNIANINSQIVGARQLSRAARPIPSSSHGSKD